MSSVAILFRVSALSRAAPLGSRHGGSAFVLGRQIALQRRIEAHGGFDVASGIARITQPSIGHAAKEMSLGQV